MASNMIHLPRRARFAVSALLAGATALAVAAIASTGEEPAPRLRASAHVEAILPSADRLPANLLRFYVVFSAPMSAGEAHTKLRLVDDAGRPVPGAFLELEEELWDPSGRRLTVLLDPGRIKRGLRANLESGAPLVEGRRYRLEIDGSWLDGSGAPLARGASKAFEAVAADRTSPDVAAWDVAAPASGLREPLVVRFPEPLDRALLSSAMAVGDAEGRPVAGEIDVRAGEREWRFTPASPWRAGRYELRAAVELEDVAGNNLRRLFDADLSRAGRVADASPFRVRRFTVLDP